MLKKNEGYFLITNWHVVTGRHRETEKSLDTYCDPDFMFVWLSTADLGSWKKKKLQLLSPNKTKLWIENKRHDKVDVVAIPLANTGDVTFHFIDLNSNYVDLALYPSKAVSILGFPFGLTSIGKFPVWKKGHIASEPNLNYNNKPSFLIDATTRQGMSGSPVILRESGFCEFENNSIIQGNFTKFLGVYSGRLQEQSEVGIVWKPIVIDEMLDDYSTLEQKSTLILQDVDF